MTNVPKPMMLFELHELEGFIAAAECLCVVEAADRLHIAQPALTRKIHKLEGKLNISLFIRKHNRIYLTPAGKRFHLDAAHIVRLCKELETTMQGFQHETIHADTVTV